MDSCVADSTAYCNDFIVAVAEAERRLFALNVYNISYTRIHAVHWPVSQFGAQPGPWLQ